MPAFVKDDHDEKLWAKAKALAKEQGQAENYAYITAIYKSLNGGKVGAEARVAGRWLARRGTSGLVIEQELKPLESKIKAILQPAVEKAIKAAIDETMQDLEPRSHRPSSEDEADEQYADQAHLMVQTAQKEVIDYLTQKLDFQLDFKVHGREVWISLGFVEV